MKEIGLAIEGGLLLGCVWVLAMLALCAVSMSVARSWRIWRRKRKVAAASALAAAAIIVGGTKPQTLSIVWDQGLRDAGSSISTNDTRMVDIRWSYESWIPNVATFKLSYVTKANPEPEPILVASTSITNLHLSVLMESDATNYIFYAEQSYIPDAPVVTNGVYHIKCIGGNNVWVPVGLKIYGDGNAILPPEAPEGESYLYDMIQGENQ
jgi:hypothetical protein